jgi:hypothetical protein
MSSPQESGSTSRGDEGQLEDAVTAFSDAVFEATQGLLSAQQQLTRTLLGGREGQTQADVGEEPAHSGDEHETDSVAVDRTSEVDSDTHEAGEAHELDDEAGEANDVDDEAAEADELDDEAAETDEVDDEDEAAETDEADREADQAGAAEGPAPSGADPAPAAQRGRRPDRRRRPQQATAGRMTSGAAN